MAVLLALICVLVLVGAGYLYWMSRMAATGLADHLEASDHMLEGLDQRLTALERRPAPAAADVQGLTQRLTALEQKPTPAAADLAPLTQRLTALEQKPAPTPPDLAPLTQRLTALEQKPAPTPPDLAPLTQRLTALEQKPAPPQPDLAPLTQRLTALEQKPVPPPPDLAPLTQRLTALEQKPVAPAPLDAAARAIIAGVAERMDQITARTDQLGTREQSDTAKLAEQLAGLGSKVTTQDGAIAAAAKAGPAVDALAGRETKLAALQGASAALAAGRPLGPISGAPPALTRYADTPPPTEASLRLSFAQAAQAAREAGQPPAADTPFLQRTWARLQSSVTVRQGDRVLVGDAISGVLGRAQAQNDAGDIAGAVATLDQLAGPAAAAMAPWKQEAQSLLDARAALLSMAHS